MTPTIRTADDAAVRILTIDNPRKRNAFAGTMAMTLLAELDRADADPSVRAVVVTGADGCFCSGHDLQEVLDHPTTAADPVANAAFSRPSQILTPVIRAVDGPAYAAGFILALNCDLRVATPGARFGAVGAALGLVPVGGQLSSCSIWSATRSPTAGCARLRRSTRPRPNATGSSRRSTTERPPSTERWTSRTRSRPCRRRSSRRSKQA